MYWGLCRKHIWNSVYFVCQHYCPTSWQFDMQKVVSGHISMSWFDSQLQLLQYCHWKLRKSRLTVSLANLLAGCQLVSNVTCCLCSEARLLFLLHFWTDLAGLRKNVTCLFSNKPKLTKLKISKVLLASSTKTLSKFSKPERQNFQVNNWVRLLLRLYQSCVASRKWDSINYLWDWPLLLAFVRWAKCQVQLTALGQLGKLWLEIS